MEAHVYLAERLRAAVRRVSRFVRPATSAQTSSSPGRSRRYRRTAWWRFVRVRGVAADTVFWTAHQLGAGYAMVRDTPNLVPVIRWLSPRARPVLPTRYAPHEAPWRSWDIVGKGARVPDAPVVVVLAGLGTPSGFMHPVLDSLTQRGFRTVVLPQLGWNFRSVGELARLVDRYLRAHTEYGPVLLVGHSKGGLIAKQVLLNDPDAKYALGAVTISSPFRGARTARYITGHSWRITREIIQLRPGVPAQLKMSGSDSVDRRIVSVIPLYDPIVGLPGTLVAGTNRTVSALGHNRLLGDERIHDLIARELRRLAAGNAVGTGDINSHAAAP